MVFAGVMSQNFPAMTIIIDKASSRGYTDHGARKSHHTFSYANYYNPNRVQFGALRVLNDNAIGPNEGIETHPHRNMEIISMPLRGELSHSDNMGNSRVIVPGEIHVMSAGTGMYHSEFNNSPKDTIKFLKLWIVPNVLNTQPKYNYYDVRPHLKHNEISTFIAPDGPVPILQEAWISWVGMDSGTTLEYTLKGEDTGVYVFVVRGDVAVEGVKLSRRDGMRITDVSTFEITSYKESYVLLAEVSMM